MILTIVLIVALIITVLLMSACPWEAVSTFTAVKTFLLGYVVVAAIVSAIVYTVYFAVTIFVTHLVQLLN